MDIMVRVVIVWAAITTMAIVLCFWILSDAMKEIRKLRRDLDAKK
jgi:hypothetical protein